MYIYIFQDEKCRLMRNLSLSMIQAQWKLIYTPLINDNCPKGLNLNECLFVSMLTTYIPCSKPGFVLQYFSRALNSSDLGLSTLLQVSKVTNHFIYYLLSMSVCLFVCLFVSNKCQNGWINRAQILSGTSHDYREGLWMLRIT